MKTFSGLLLSIAFACASIAEVEKYMDENYKTLSTEYQNAKSWEVRRDVCIRAIDSEVIKIGSSFKEIIAFFGGDKKPVSGKNRESTLVVDFSNQIANKSSFEAVPFVGWYIVIKTIDGTTVSEYYLTNTHK